jgi:hypothetical protein
VGQLSPQPFNLAWGNLAQHVPSFHEPFSRDRLPHTVKGPGGRNATVRKFVEMDQRNVEFTNWTKCTRHPADSGPGAINRLRIQ